MTNVTTENGTQRAQQTFGSVTWYTETCYKCGVPFAFTMDYYHTLKRTQREFHCPNGHPQYYTESTEQKLRKQLQDAESAKAGAEYRARMAAQELNEARKREKIAVGETRRLETRIAAGVCPCCNRHFTNLERHMKSKHPDKVHVPFHMTDAERQMLVSWPQCNGSRAVRRRFVAAHAALTDEQIARLMIDGCLYNTQQVPAVAKMVANLRQKL